MKIIIENFQVLGEENRQTLADSWHGRMEHMRARASPSGKINGATEGVNTGA